MHQRHRHWKVKQALLIGMLKISKVPGSTYDFYSCFGTVDDATTVYGTIENLA